MLPEPDGGAGTPAPLRTRIELHVSDLEASVAFYERLGFTAVGRSSGHASLDRAGARLKLQSDAYIRGHDHYFTPHLEARPRGVGVETIVEVADRADLEAAHAAAVELGCVVRELREREWGAMDFRVADPDGYFLRFTTPLRR